MIYCPWFGRLSVQRAPQLNECQTSRKKFGRGQCIFTKLFVVNSCMWRGEKNQIIKHYDLRINSPTKIQA